MSRPDHDRSVDGAPGLGSVLSFMRLLWALDHELQAISKRMARTMGITGPQRLVLLVVDRSPMISAGCLAATLHLHPSTLTGVLGRLVRRRLLVRHLDPKDGRRALFTLTAAGKRLAAPVPGTVESAVRPVLASTPQGRIAATRSLLCALATGLRMTALGQGPRVRSPR